VVRAQSEDTALTISMKGVNIMDILKYVSATQVAELEAMAKVWTDFRNTKLRGFQPDISSMTIDPAIFHHVWGKT
jgi:hypothetical protein